MKPPLPPTPGITIDSQEVVWSGRSTLRLVHFTHRRFDGSMSGPIVWELWQRGAAAAVLPYDPAADHVVLIEQFRLPVHAAGHEPVMREVPAGMCEAGETPEATIRRELVEEAGVAARRMHPIGTYVLSAGSSDETVALFAGEVAIPPGTLGEAHGQRDDSEDIRVLALPADVAIAQALDGTLNNPITAIALLWLAQKRDWLRGEWA